MPVESYSDSIPVALHWPALQAALAQQATLTRAEVLALFRRAAPDLKESTLDWRIHELVRRQLLAPAGRGRYALAQGSPRPAYQPALTPAERTLWRQLCKPLQLPAGCLWSTAWANEFSQHQAARTFTVLEVPRDYLSAAFYQLQDRHPGRVFLNPAPDVFTYYVAEAARPLVVLPFVSRAPVQLLGQVPVPRLEKLLVDLFSRPALFAAFQGHELQTIFAAAHRRYPLDERTLLRYAQRRHKAEALRQFLQQVPSWPESVLPA